MKKVYIVTYTVNPKMIIYTDFEEAIAAMVEYVINDNDFSDSAADAYCFDYSISAPNGDYSVEALAAFRSLVKNHILFTYYTTGIGQDFREACQITEGWFKE